jgi:hypothetical protein
MSLEKEDATPKFKSRVLFSETLFRDPSFIPA